MNIPLLASDIVRRVHHSQDSAINLEIVVVGLIQEEVDRDRSYLAIELLDYARHGTKCRAPFGDNPCTCGLDDLRVRTGK